MDNSPRTLARARSLRRTETSAEKRLWGYLRDRRLGGYKFRRQIPIPPYIADFACISHNLVVELDGATHSEDHEIWHDEKRTAFLESKGFKVHRILNSDVFRSLADVLDGILLILQQQRRR
jgi:very-short-patch-repair endonuclease